MMAALGRSASSIRCGKDSPVSGIGFCGEFQLKNAVELRSSQWTEHSWSASILRSTKSGKNREALRMYEEMCRCGVKPSTRIFIASLKACSSLQDLETARRIHLDFVRSGCEWDLHVATTLVDVYAKCRSLADAREAFEKLPHRDVVLWNAMILGYAQMDQAEEALQLYTRMKQEGVEPHGRTYVSALKACIAMGGKKQAENTADKARCLQTVRAIHTDIVKGNFQSNVYVGTMLVDAYAKCGSLNDARCVFEKMSHRDVVSWNAIISAYAEEDDGEEGLQLFTRMQQEGMVPDGRTFVSALKACSRLAELEQANEGHGKAVKRKCLQAVRALHLDIVKRNFQSNRFVGNMLVNLYAKCGNLEDARRVFEKMPHRDMVSWTTMIFAYSQRNRGEEALELFALMQQEGVVPDGQTYVSVLKACSSLAEGSVALKRRCMETVRTIHKDIVKQGLDMDVFVGTMLVDVYAKCGNLGAARCVFEKMPCRNVASWNVMIFGYIQAGNGEQGLNLFVRMQQEGVVPDGWTYVSVLKAWGSLAELEETNGGNIIALRTKCLNAVRGVHFDILKRKLNTDVFIGNTLVGLYAKCNSMQDARHVFDNMPSRDVVSWTAIISGYAQVDRGTEALELYSQMQQEGVAPNDQAYASALKACGCSSGVEKGKEIHAEILKAGPQAMNSFVTSSLIGMYGKCGSMMDAQAVFDASPTRDIVTWSALIAGYAHQGESEVVFHLFETMKHEGIQPDSITFLSVLTVCCHVGLVERGQKYFEAMSRDYAITPTMRHFTCMVDLLGRAGHLDKAMEMARSMPIQSNRAVWNCVLGACQKWNNVELGTQAFKCAIKMDRNVAAAYVMMSNIYAAAGMRKEAEEIQAMRLESGAWKHPGQSQWTDLNGRAHVFVTGNRGHMAS